MNARSAALLRRRAYLDLASRRARPGSGSGRDFLLARDWKELPVAFDLARLTTPFVIVGGVATALYMPRRLTLDVDLLVVANDAPHLYQELLAAGWVREGSLSIGGTTWRAPDGGNVDVLESRERWARAAIEHPNRAPTGEPVIGLPYLVLIKLAASRGQDLADVSRMLGTADEALLAQVRAVVRRERPDDRADLDKLIRLGRLELQQPE